MMANNFSTFPSFSASSYTEAKEAVHLGPELNGTCMLDDSALRIPLATFYSIFFVFGLAGNLLVLWVFLTVNSKKNSVHVFLINTAIADLLLAICLPFRVFYHSNHNHWTLGFIMCKVVGNVFYMNMYISITLLGLISVDRYIKILHSTQRCSLPKRCSVVLCYIIWAISIAAIIPMISFSEDREEQYKCFQYKRRQKAKWKAHFNSILVALFWLVFLALIVSYRKIAMKLLATSKQKPGLPNSLKYTRTAKKSFFILFLFTICFVPYHAFRIVYIHSQISKMSCYWIGIIDKANEVMLLLSTFNSCLDPVMYFLLCGSVRKTVLRIFNSFICSQDNNAKNLNAKYQTTSLCNEHSSNQTTNNSSSQLKSLQSKTMLSSHI
ncbi:putative G-protein coupled receptor 34 [Scleropages formosus]|uniref:Probable G-protein coupled receptor 34 n=1 Tax=Scleropages formosus TaxID=113540 RepID=A0A0P7VRP1_SCLFO|nr:putative G-protein coupled receptor 34 [Scleropages formosus]